MEAVIRARVVRHDGASLLVVAGGHDGGDGAPRPIALARRIDPEPVVGDWVDIEVATDRVVGVHGRRSLLRRRAAGRDEEQALAANVDVVFLVCGLDRRVKPGRIQRGATLAWDAGATPVVVLTKAADVGDELVADAVAAVHATNPGIVVLVTSAREGMGLDALVDVARGRTVTLLGESGAGKSTIVNALLGTEVAVTGDVRAGDAKGRHTTTARQLHPLPFGGALIDTPGIRAVGLWVDTDAVDTAFADVDDLATACRFTDCRHDGEPGCAVLAAVAAGTLDGGRLEAWRRLRREAEAAARRSSPHEARRSEKRFARVTKEAQARKGRPS